MGKIGFLWSRTHFSKHVVLQVFDALASGRRNDARRCFFVGKNAVSEALRCKLLGWSHSGFSVHNQVRIEEGDAAGRSKLAAYMLRSPMSLEKMIYDADTGTVIYRSKMPASAAEATGGRGSWPRSR